jgi:hypothetical protein
VHAEINNIKMATKYRLFLILKEFLFLYKYERNKYNTENIKKLGYTSIIDYDIRNTKDSVKLEKEL